MRRYRLFFLALLLVGTLLGSFHHHDNAGGVDENCFVCIVQHVLSGGNLNEAFVLEAIALFFSIPLLRKRVCLLSEVSYTYASRAPPSLS